jgi:DNA-binding NtrC family response regulator
MSEKAKILFVDDEERIVNLLKIMFRSTYDVFTATNGHQALQIVAANQIHVVVSDQRMPEMLGIDLLAKVRELSPNTMRLLLTGYSDLAAIVGSVNDGEVFRFISKPWDQEDIKKTLAEAVEIATTTWQTKPGVAASYTQEAANAPVAAKRKHELLIIDDNAMDREWIARLFEADYQTFAAGSIAEAMSVLDQRNIGVIVSESNVGGEDAGMLLKILKQKYPVITTVMLTGNADADEVIKLINQAQIYRFATKPIRKASLELAVASAAKQHERLVTDPVLRARHRVARSEETEHSSLAKSIMRGLAGLTARFSLFGRQTT